MTSDLRSQNGFTLVEILVVVLIVGILAVIAVPAFLNQRTRSQDAEAKVYLVAARKALEVWHTERATYAGADIAELVKIEPALGRMRGAELDVTDDAFSISADSASDSGGKRFTIALLDGAIERTCENAGAGACPADGTW